MNVVIMADGQSPATQPVAMLGFGNNDGWSNGDLWGRFLPPDTSLTVDHSRVLSHISWRRISGW